MHRIETEGSVISKSLSLLLIAMCSGLVMSNFRGRCLNRSLSVIAPMAWQLNINWCRQVFESIINPPQICLHHKHSVSQAQQASVFTVHPLLHTVFTGQNLLAARTGNRNCVL